MYSLHLDGSPISCCEIFSEHWKNIKDYSFKIELLASLLFILRTIGIGMVSIFLCGIWIFTACVIPSICKNRKHGILFMERKMARIEKRYPNLKLTQQQTEEQTELVPMA